MEVENLISNQTLSEKSRFEEPNAVGALMLLISGLIHLKSRRILVLTYNLPAKLVSGRKMECMLLTHT